MWAATDGEAIPYRFVGLLTGAALMTKYQAIPYLIGAGIVLIFLLVSKRYRVPMREVVVGVALSLLLFAPFLLKNLVLLDAPFYPFLSDTRFEPWVEALSIGVSGSPSQFAVLANAREEFRFFDWLINPGDLTVEESGFLYGLPLVFLVGTLAIFTNKKTLAFYLATPVVVGIVLIVAASRLTNLRYLLPVVPLLAMATSIAVSEIIGQTKVGIARIILFGVAFIAIVPLASWARYEYPGGRLQAGLGIISEQQWASREANPSHQKVRLLRAYLSGLSMYSDQRILLLNEARGMLLNADVIQDNGHNAWPYLASGLKAGECLDPDSIPYVVRGDDTLRYLVSKGVTEKQLAIEEWEVFSQNCLTLRDQIPGYEVFEVKGAGG